jgi:transposase
LPCGAGCLTVPPNIPVVPLPAKRPELNPQENVWQLTRDNLSNRVFRSYDQIVDHCCDAWNKLVNQRPSECQNGPTGSNQRVLVI